MHKLFENAFAKVQGPEGRFIKLDELSYAVVFADLSPRDANKICLVVARDVCVALFGDQVDEASVRTVIAEMAIPAEIALEMYGSMIESVVESDGSKTVVTQSIHSGSAGPVETVRRRLSLPTSPLAQVEAAHNELSSEGIQLALFPVWDLKRGVSNSLFVAPFTGEIGRPLSVGGIVFGKLGCRLSLRRGALF